MLILIDAGNTRVKWAIAADGAAPGQWQSHGAVLHAELDTLREKLVTPAGAPACRIVVCNVAGPDMAQRLDALLPVAAEYFRASAELHGMHNHYQNPAQLGSDRFAAAFGARALEPGQPIVVATCGTATTVDAVNAQGDFLGGMILPGLGTMAKSLALNTAQLPQVAPGKLPQGFANNTTDAILSGIVAAQAGAIERAMRQLGAQLCILSGGASEYIAPALGMPHRIVDNIVLTGLHAAVLQEV
jgi:type III pantothenate kinase